MTEIKSKVVEFDLEKHPNADSLSIAKIRNTGWQCIVRTEDFANTNLAVYFQIDSQLDTTRQEFKFLDKDNKQKPARIRTMKLRGILSQGLLIPAPANTNLDDDLTEFYGVTRYEPPVLPQFAGGMIKNPPAFFKYTSIENAKNYPNVFNNGENIRITEKCHGSSWRVSYIVNENNNLEFCVGSHNVTKDPEDTNEYSKIARQLDIKEKLEPIVKRINPKLNFIIFGELVGHKIQHLSYGYGPNQRGIKIFDIMIDGIYQTYEFIDEVCMELGLDMVPVLYRGPFDYNVVMSFRDGQSTIDKANHIREGVVVTSEPERFDNRIGRVILKYISDDYLLDQGKKNSTDGH